MTQDTFLNTLLPMQPALQLVAERMLCSADEAEDTVQEVVIELWEKRDKLKHILNLEGYAMQTLKNHCISSLRKRKVVPVDDIDRLGDFSDEDATAESALLEERAAKLDCMMGRLPERQREIIKMKYLDQMSHEEIQRKLKMSSENVYTTLSRAVSALRKMMMNNE